MVVAARGWQAYVETPHETSAYTLFSHEIVQHSPLSINIILPSESPRASLFKPTYLSASFGDLMSSQAVEL